MLETPLAPTVACGHTVVNTQVYFLRNPLKPAETRCWVLLSLRRKTRKHGLNMQKRRFITHLGVGQKTCHFNDPDHPKKLFLNRPWKVLFHSIYYMLHNVDPYPSPRLAFFPTLPSRCFPIACRFQKIWTISLALAMRKSGSSSFIPPNYTTREIF